MIPDSHRDLLVGSGPAVLATLAADGYPQTTAVGFLGDGEAMRLTARSDTHKVRNLKRNPACTFFRVDPENPSRTIEVRCRAELIPDDDYFWADKVGAANGGFSGDQIRGWDGPGATRTSILLHPVKVNVRP